MATRSRIRVCITEPGKVFTKAIYCHWDGYPDNMLPLLRENYGTPARAKALVKLGSLSYLAKKLKPKKGQEHSFDSPAPDVTVAYHRDRGEDLRFISDNEGRDGREQYNYVYNGTAWHLE